MSQLKLYGLKRCSTCVKALAWLDDNKQIYTFTDYREDPIDPHQLLAWQEQLGGWEKLVNRASMTWRNLPEDRKAPENDAAWLTLIAEFPTLIKRPVLLKDETVMVGFSEKKYAALLQESGA